MTIAMTQTDLYDWLLRMGVREPAVIMLGGRCVCGRWETIGETTLPSGGYVLRTGRVGINVLGEGETWDAAHVAAMRKLGVDRGRTYSEIKRV